MRFIIIIWIIFESAKLVYAENFVNSVRKVKSDHIFDKLIVVSLFLEVVFIIGMVYLLIKYNFPVQLFVLGLIALTVIFTKLRKAYQNTALLTRLDSIFTLPILFCIYYYC
jgi:hypothetical protein